MAKLVDLARTDAERKKIQEGNESPTDIDNVPEYDWGTSFCLNDTTLEKLGITELPKPGDELKIQGVVKVTGARMSADEKGASRGVDLQITHLAVDTAPDLKKGLKAMYGSASDANDQPD